MSETNDHHIGKFGPCVFYLKRRLLSDEYGTNVVNVFASGDYLGYFVEQGWIETVKDGLYSAELDRIDGRGIFTVYFGDGWMLSSSPRYLPDFKVLAPAVRERNAMGKLNYVDQRHIWEKVYENCKKYGWKVSVLVETAPHPSVPPKGKE